MTVGAAMCRRSGGAIVATQNGPSPSPITPMVGIGTALWCLTLPLWHFGLALP
jgi:hypothetical protein